MSRYRYAENLSYQTSSSSAQSYRSTYEQDTGRDYAAVTVLTVKSREQEKAREHAELAHEQKQDGKQPGRQLPIVTGLLGEVKDYPADLQEILWPLFQNDERRIQVELKLREIRNDKAVLTAIAGKFLEALSFDIDKSSKFDGPLGKLANPVPISFQANLWETALKPDQHDSKLDQAVAPTAHDESSGSSGDDPSVAVSTHIVTGNTNVPHQGPSFMEWGQFREHSLASATNFVEAHHETILATYENMNLEISVGTNIASLTVSGFVKKIRDWLHKRDLFAIWRSTPRTLLLLEERGLEVDNRQLDALDKELFDTAKFAQFDHRLTTLTYGDGPYGSIMLFWSADNETIPRGAKSLRPTAAMEHVPKAILARIEENVHNSSRTALRVKKQKVEWLSCEEKDKPIYAVLENKGEKIGQGYTPGLADSLSIDPSGKNADGILATTQQILALWHIKASILCNVRSSNVRVIRDPAAIGYATFAPGQVWRGVQILKGPDRTGHETGNPRVVVLQSLSGGWLKERLFWG